MAETLDDVCIYLLAELVKLQQRVDRLEKKINNG